MNISSRLGFIVLASIAAGCTDSEHAGPGLGSGASTSDAQPAFMPYVPTTIAPPATAGAPGTGPVGTGGAAGAAMPAPACGNQGATMPPPPIRPSLMLTLAAA